MRATRLFIAAGLGFSLLACGDVTSPITGGPDAAVAGVTPSLPVSEIRSAPPLDIRHGSWWAVQGKQTRFIASFREAHKAKSLFLAFTIPSSAQLVAPGGRRLATGDSIRITVDLVSKTLEAHFAPHGLTFADGVPAQLAISYAYADLRGLPATALAVWYQPTTSEPWMKQSTAIDRDHKLATTEISHFSQYALRFDNYAVAYSAVAR